MPVRFIIPVMSAMLLIASCSTTVSTETAAPETQTSSEESQAEQLAVYIEDEIAIKGADPVAYFTESAYVPGSDQFTHEWNGATWHFANAENQDLFASDPEKYAPQYGGFCAWAVSQGNVAPIDPTAWKIVDDRLYLNYNTKIQARWEKDIPGNIAQANANWPGVLQ